MTSPMISAALEQYFSSPWILSSPRFKLSLPYLHSILIYLGPSSWKPRQPNLPQILEYIKAVGLQEKNREQGRRSFRFNASDATWRKTLPAACIKIKLLKKTFCRAIASSPNSAECHKIIKEVTHAIVSKSNSAPDAKLSCQEPKPRRIRKDLYLYFNHRLGSLLKG